MQSDLHACAGRGTVWEGSADESTGREEYRLLYYTLIHIGFFTCRVLLVTKVRFQLR